MSTTSPCYLVSHYDEDAASGLAQILVPLVSENLAKAGGGLRAARRIRHPIGLRNTDDGTAATIVFGNDQAFVASSLIDDPPVLIEASVAQLLAVSELKIRGAGLLPIGFFGREGLGILGAIATRRLKVRGLFLRPLTVLRFLAVVSVAE